MKKQLFSSLMALALVGCVSTPPAGAGGADQALADAASALSAVQDASGEWKIIDKATGGKAVPLSKILMVAKEKAAAGETDEAVRMANRVAEFAALGVEQSKQQMSAQPYY